uniref:Cytoinsectotoxin-3 n=2 Tax=Lachesana tarabaevi TaxID=379576 RepID=CTX3_LACTA|nr:RecName: Full=Cytoinsectotoxin-3; Short=CIT-3 [Lachesana tarabaevi]
KSKWGKLWGKAKGVAKKGAKKVKKALLKALKKKLAKEMAKSKGVDYKEMKAKVMAMDKAKVLQEAMKILGKKAMDKYLS